MATTQPAGRRGQELVARQRAAHEHGSCADHGVHLQHARGQVDPNAMA